MRDKITAALKKLGPSSPNALAIEIGEEPGSVGYHLRHMLSEEEVKASGSSNDRLYALPDQELRPAAAPQARAKKKKSKARAAKVSPARARAPKAPPAAQTTLGGFIAAATADGRLVLFVPGQAPLVFDDAQTEKVAELCFAHFRD